MHCDLIYKGLLALDKSLIFYIEINNTNALCNKSMQFMVTTTLNLAIIRSAYKQTSNT